MKHTHKPGFKSGWLFCADELADALSHAASDILSFERRVDSSAFCGRNALLHASDQPGVMVMACGRRRLLGKQQLAKQTSGSQKKRDYSRIGLVNMTGPIDVYCRLAQSTNTALGQLLVINQVAGERLHDLDLGGAETSDAHLGALVGVGRRIAVLRPDDSVSTLTAAERAQWQGYLGRHATRRLTFVARNGFVKDDAWHRTAKLLLNRYANHERFVRRTVERFSTVSPAVVASLARERAIRKFLPAARDAILQKHPDAFPAASKRALKDLARQVADERDWKGYFRGSAMPTHDRTKRFTSLAATPAHESDATGQATSAEILTNEEKWASMGVPEEHQARYRRLIHNELLTKPERTGRVSDLSSCFPEASATAEAANLEQRWIEDLNAVAVEQRRELALRTIEELERELAELHEQLGAHVRLLDAMSYSAFQRRKARVARNLAGRLTYKPAVIEVWEVTTLPQRDIVASAAPRMESPTEITLDVTHFDSSSEAGCRLRMELTNEGATTPVAASDAIPDLGSLPSIPPSLYEPAGISISPKLKVTATGSSEAYLIADRVQRVYNPALARPTGLQAALLERPTLIAQGVEFVQTRLTNYGYRVSIPDTVVNRLAIAAERSLHNQVPLRPIQPFEATAYYQFGPMVAQATLHDPDGNPIWIAGRQYLITPGWRREHRIVSEDERTATEVAIDELGTTHEREVVDFGVTYWTIATERGPVVIDEASIREEVELAVSAQLYPERLTEALDSVIRQTRVEENASAQRATVTATGEMSDEDFAMLQSVRLALSATPPSPQPGATTEAKVEWPEWRPFLDELVEVFPPPVPEPAAVFARDKVEQLMQRIVGRFGPKYQRGDVPVPPRVDEEAFQLWIADQRSRSPAAVANCAS